MARVVLVGAAPDRGPAATAGLALEAVGDLVAILGLVLEAVGDAVVRESG